MRVMELCKRLPVPHSQRRACSTSARAAHLRLLAPPGSCARVGARLALQCPWAAVAGPDLEHLANLAGAWA